MKLINLNYIDMLRYKVYTKCDKHTTGELYSFIYFSLVPVDDIPLHCVQTVFDTLTTKLGDWDILN